MVFQDYALFPHLTIEENISYGLSKWNRKERNERVDEMLRLVGLNAFKKRYPHQLSGGQQQRIALARALAPRPTLILMDEPFSNLDTVLKEQVREDIRRIIKSTQTTAIFVTHDTKDALSTADRIAILKDGKIQQIGKPEELFDTPENIYVANFFGKINVLNAITIPGGYKTPIGFLPCTATAKQGEKVTLVIRPENIHLCTEGTSPLCGKVKNVIYLGDQKQVSLAIENNYQPYRLLLKVENDIKMEKGEKIHFKVVQEKIQVLDTCWYPDPSH
jgi:iron(III) transport system ATP-binding protein